MKGIYKFDADFGRMGDLTGVLVSTAEDIDNLVGKRVYFGEVLGKHSDVSLDVEHDNFTLVTEDEKFIELFEQYGLENGYNPFDYDLEEEEEEYDDEDETE